MALVEIPKADDADEIRKGSLPIKHEGGPLHSNSGNTRSADADLDSADPSFVEEVCVTQEITVSGISAFRIVHPFRLPDLFLGLGFRRFTSFFASAFLFLISGGRAGLCAYFRLSVC